MGACRIGGACAEEHDLGMAHAFEYIQCDIPEGVTIREWRHARVPQPRRTRRLRVMVRRARRGIGF
jgi:hypothetical protein